jgi:FAD synthetase
MVRVLALGIFDILHLGHLYYLNQARKLGDELVVVVASDLKASLENEEMENPIFPEIVRLEIIKSLKPVDQAILNNGRDFYKVIQDIDPDIIALGYNQKFDIAKMEKELTNMGLNTKVKRLRKHPNSLLSSSKIIHKIISRDWT